ARRPSPRRDDETWDEILERDAADASYQPARSHVIQGFLDKEQLSIPVDELGSLDLQGFDAVLGEPGTQVVTVSLDEAASGEPGVVGDLGDCRWRRDERLCFLVCAELDVSQDQAVQWRVEDIDAQRRNAHPRLGQHRGRE